MTTSANQGDTVTKANLCHNNVKISISAHIGIMDNENNERKENDEETPSVQSTQTYHVSEILKAIGLEKIPSPKSSNETGAGDLRLVVRGVVERFGLHHDFTLYLGREANREDGKPSLDLSPYDATNLGVSRHHARIYLEGGKLYIEDLNSTNGTYVSGKRLEVPTEIKKGDTLTLGKLNLQVLFRLPTGYLK